MLLFTAFARYVPGIVAVEVCVAVMLLLTSHLLRFCIRRYGWLQRPLPALLGRLALTNAGLAVGAQIVINLLLTYVVRPSGLQAQQNQGLMFLGYVLNTYFVLWLWAALYVGLHYLRGYRQAEIDKWKLTAAVREAEMRTLKAQLNPHFLFNGLNNIRALVTEDPAGARTMMTHLSDLLRHTIQFSDAEQVTVARELALVRHYLALEALQLEERLAYSLDVDPAGPARPTTAHDAAVAGRKRHQARPVAAAGGRPHYALRRPRRRWRDATSHRPQYRPLPAHRAGGRGAAQHPRAAGAALRRGRLPHHPQRPRPPRHRNGPAAPASFVGRS